MALLIVVVAITTACKSYMLKVRVPSVNMLVSCESFEMPVPCHFISLSHSEVAGLAGAQRMKRPSYCGFRVSQAYISSTMRSKRF